MPLFYIIMQHEAFNTAEFWFPDVLPVSFFFPIQLLKPKIIFWVKGWSSAVYKYIIGVPGI